MVRDRWCHLGHDGGQVRGSDAARPGWDGARGLKVLVLVLVLVLVAAVAVLLDVLLEPVLVVVLVAVLIGVVVGLGHLGHTELVRPRGLWCCGSVRPMTSTLGASYFLADTARTAGAVTGTVLGFAIAVALVVFGVRFVRTPAAGTGRKVAGVVMIVLGVLFALGGLSSLAGVAGSS